MIEFFNNIKNILVSGLLILVDHPVAFALVFFAIGMERFSSYGLSEFWAVAFVFLSFFGFIFLLAWKRDKGYYKLF